MKNAYKTNTATRNVLASAVVLTLTDPVLYTRPWVASTKVWTLIPKDKMSVGGWGGILEDRCVPSDESLFNKFRDKAAGKE